jgi:hypothetical protein
LDSRHNGGKKNQQDNSAHHHQLSSVLVTAGQAASPLGVQELAARATIGQISSRELVRRK